MQSKLQVGKNKAIIKIREEINEMETTKVIYIINKTKIDFLKSSF